MNLLSDEGLPPGIRKDAGGPSYYYKVWKRQNHTIAG